MTAADQTRPSYFAADMPIPQPDRLTEPFWSGCRERRLLIQHCTVCGTYRHLPSDVCSNCQSTEYDWVESRGDGTVFTYTIVWHSVHSSTNQKIPYNVVVVQLDDCGGVLVMSNLVDCGPDDVRVGLPVELTWDDVGDDMVLYRFKRRS